MLWKKAIGVGWQHTSITSTGRKINYVQFVRWIGRDTLAKEPTEVSESQLLKPASKTLVKEPKDSESLIIKPTSKTLVKEPTFAGSQISKPVFHRADQWDKRKNVAMIDEFGTHTYGELSVKSRLVANALEAELGGDAEKNKKVM